MVDYYNTTIRYAHTCSHLKKIYDPDHSHSIMNPGSLRKVTSNLAT